MNVLANNSGKRDTVVAFEFGGLYAVALAVMTFLVVTATTSLLEPALIIRIWKYALLPLLTLALFRASWRHGGTDLGPFFMRVGFAYLAWVSAGVLQWSLDRALGLGVGTFVRDLLYGLYYCGLLWAIEWAPTGVRGSRGEKIVSLAGSLMLVGGSLIYLRILPQAASPGDRVPYLALYTVLDLYITGRLALLAYRAGHTRLRTVLGLLALSGLMVSLAEAVETALQAGALPLADSSPLTLLWVIAGLPLLFATHVARFDFAKADRGSRSMGLSGASLWSPLIAYGFALPLVHVILYAIGLGVEDAERARGFFVLGWLVALAMLIFTQRWVLAKRVLAAEQALRDSHERIRRLTRAREEAGEGERRHLARELHDELGQLLVALRIELAWVAKCRGDGDANRDRRLESATSLVRGALDSVRRVASSLHPRILDDLGLNAALEELVAETAKRGNVAVRLIADPARPRLSPEEETALYRIAQECLTNCLKHAHADRIEVELTRGEEVELEIRDDGIGLRSSRQSVGAGFGLLGIHERAHSLGARVALGSGIEGRGFSVRVSVAEAPLVEPRRSGGNENRVWNRGVVA